MPDFDRDLEATLRGKLAGSTIGMIDTALDNMEYQIDHGMMLALKQGPITTEQATQAWYHKYAIFELRQKLTQAATQGHAASRRITPKMTEGFNGQQA